MIDITGMTAEHLQAAVELVGVCDYTYALDADWLRYRTIEDPRASAVVPLVARDGDDLVGFCFGHMYQEQGWIKLFGVRKETRRHGVATALLAEAEERLRALGATQVTVGASGPNFFQPGVDVLSTDAISFLLARGYQGGRCPNINMIVDLAKADLETDTEESRLAAQSITVRRATTQDVAATSQFALDTFSEGWQFETSLAARVAPHPMYIALEGERVIAFACYDVTGPSWFGPTGTDPRYRLRGIGQVLLKRCMRDIRERGEVTAEIVWTGPIGYYARTVGARICRVFWQFRKQLVESEGNPPS